MELARADRARTTARVVVHEPSLADVRDDLGGEAMEWKDRCIGPDPRFTEALKAPEAAGKRIRSAVAVEGEPDLSVPSPLVPTI